MQTIEQGVELLRQKWPQTHAVPSDLGATLITVPSVQLRGYDMDICTVLFVTPPGFPFAPPNGFFTDICIRLPNGAWPTMTRCFNPSVEGSGVSGSAFDYEFTWPQWRTVMRWWWRVQAWNPNRDDLVTYMNVIRQRLHPAR